MADGRARRPGYWPAATSAIALLRGHRLRPTGNREGWTGLVCLAGVRATAVAIPGRGAMACCRQRGRSGSAGRIGCRYHGRRTGCRLLPHRRTGAQRAVNFGARPVGGDPQRPEARRQPSPALWPSAHTQPPRRLHTVKALAGPPPAITRITPTRGGSEAPVRSLTPCAECPILAVRGSGRCPLVFPVPHSLLIMPGCSL